MADLLFMKVAGVAGIALSTSLCFAVSAGMVYVALTKRIRELEA
jgi:hypothetical protein